MPKKSSNKKKYTYISLFSSAGVGCFGFKEEGFECIATSELIKNRINVQKANHKCKYNNGYACGDITKEETKQQVMEAVSFWKREENINDVDVVIATPPCQGMSTANYKKKDEQKRNSLVVEAINLIKEIEPKIFIFENVRAFMTTICSDVDGIDKTIGEAVQNNLEDKYNIYHKVINFKDYGVPSSRPRTIVIGTRKSMQNISPLNLFPLKQHEITLREAIGNFIHLENPNDYDPNNLFHSFRYYDEYMREWIHDLKEGESAFSNPKNKMPYKIVNGKKQVLKCGHIGNKFRRLFWDKPCACIATRNDQLASMDTIHPSDDRVLSIAELMKIMTIPDKFKWFDYSKYKTEEELKKAISDNELNIRRCIGEAVPTIIMKQIANNIKQMFEYDDYVNNQMTKPNKKNYYISSFIQEKENSNAEAKETGSFYTPQSVIFNCLKHINNIKKEVHILEPSVGGGNFIIPIINSFDNSEKLYIDINDVDPKAINKTKKRIEKLNYDKKKIIITYTKCDFIEYMFTKKYDYIIGNPPFLKTKGKFKEKYKKILDFKCDNLFGIFLEKMYLQSNNIIMVLPKVFLMAPEFDELRDKYSKYNVVSIYDYGVKAFKDVFVEIISIFFTNKKTNKTIVCNPVENYYKELKQGYIFHTKSWLIYRDKWFDNYIKTLKLDFFDYFRDRAITNNRLKENGKIWVLKSKNILDDGKIIHKEKYDKYIDSCENLPVAKYINTDSIIMPSFTYNTRASILPKNAVANGSIAILIIKDNNYKIKDVDLTLYSTDEFRKYYSIVKNKAKFTINIDKNAIYYIGVKGDEIKNTRK